MSDIKRLPGETKEDARLRAQKEWLAAEPERRRADQAARRKLYTHLLFWKFCPHKRCRRACACRGDVERCYNRFWPMVPEDTKVMIRAYLTASVRDQLPSHEAVRHAKQEVARWREMETRFAQQKVRARAETVKPAATAPESRFVAENRAPRVRRL